VHLLLSEQYIESATHGATIKALFGVSVVIWQRRRTSGKKFKWHSLHYCGYLPYGNLLPLALDGFNCQSPQLGTLLTPVHIYTSVLTKFLWVRACMW